MNKVECFNASHIHGTYLMDVIVRVNVKGLLSGITGFCYNSTVKLSYGFSDLFLLKNTIIVRP